VTAGRHDARRVLVLNGPNLGRLGKREPGIYGTASYQDLVELCQSAGAGFGFDVDVRQTDSEGELIGWVHEAADEALPLILNAAAFTHYSYALQDALKMRTAPLIEVHISNVGARAGAEPFRHTSVVTPVADGVIAGFGFLSYELALRAVAGLLERLWSSWSVSWGRARRPSGISSPRSWACRSWTATW
jgi:3-dehydroquinate dehydratase II